MAPDIVESQLFASLRLALLPLFDAEIIKGLSNDAPTPKGDYIVLTPILQDRLSTNHTRYLPDIRAESAQYDYVIQVDCYGVQSGNMANAINLLFRSDFFDSSGVHPLYPSEPRQLMFESGERQMIERWTQDLHLSYNPEAQLPQQFAEEIALASIEGIPAIGE